MRRTRTSACGVAMMVAAGLTHAGAALAQVTFPSVIDRALGVRTALDPPLAPITRWRVEIADAELFGVAGLRVVGVRSTAALGSARLCAEFAQVAAPVGAHARTLAEVGYVRAGTWQGGVRAGVERVALDRARPERSLIGGAYSRADAGPVSVLADLEVVSSAFARSTSVGVAAIGRAGSLVLLVASLRFDDERIAAVGISVSVRVHARLGLTGGYDDGTETSRVAARIAAAGMEVATGVTHHPVLGISHGVSLAWAR